MKLGGYMHCTKILSEFECQGQRSISPGTKAQCWLDQSLFSGHI